MKNGKNPTRDQRKFIASFGLVASDWRVMKNTSEVMTLIKKKTNEILTLPKEG